MPDTPASTPAGFAIRRATRDESEGVAAIVRAAFQTVANEIGMDIPPVHECAEDARATFDAGDATIVAQASDGALIGTVRGETMSPGSVMVRRLAVLPANRGAGVARALMCALEDAYPDAERFELFTGANASGPLALYASLGYQPMEQPRDAVEWLVYLEKCRES